MENNNNLISETLKQNSLTSKKGFLALYVSTDGKGKENKEKDFSRYLRGTKNDFKFLLTKNKNKLSEELLSDGFILLYNSKSEDSSNEFISRYVENFGPVIIFKKDESDLDTKTHRWIGKKILKKCDSLGYDLDNLSVGIF